MRRRTDFKNRTTSSSPTKTEYSGKAESKRESDVRQGSRQMCWPW